MYSTRFSCLCAVQGGRFIVVCRYTIVALAAIHFTYCIASYIHFHTQLSFTRGTHFNAQRLTCIS